MKNSVTQTANEDAFSTYQKFVIGLLVFLQFTIILDFMIMAPLGAIIMPYFKISPAQFGSVVSAYAFSAGISGFLASGFADRFDRKKILLFFYVGFVFGTLLCALAPNYYFLLFARMFTGIFGGVVGSVVMAITTDLFDLKKRGQVIGLLQTAFGASQILGIPLGLYFSNISSWHAPFYMIVIVSTLVGFLIVFKLKPITEHLKLQNDKNVYEHLKKTFNSFRNQLGFLATALVSIGGFLLMPFTSAYMVHNLGVDISKLPLIYLTTGIFALFSGPVIGRMSGIFGPLKVFYFGAFLTIIMVLIYTNLGVTPLPVVIFVNIIFFIGIFSRIIPSQALVSAIPDPAHRGSFMSINSSLQQISGGVASLVAGLIVVENADKTLTHFDTLGFILVGTVLISVVLIQKINFLADKK